MKRLDKTHLIDTFGAGYPMALTVDEGEVFVVETFNLLDDLEAFRKAMGEEKPKIMNVTGPIFVKGARTGNALRVDILDLEITGGHGGMACLPGIGPFGDKIEQMQARHLKVDRHYVHFSDTLKIPINPMLGKVGVAPSDHESPSNLAGPHGGNMDNKQIAKGASVYLPVFVDGAYLGVGDAHALMGDGECISAVEAESEVTLRCRVVTDLRLTHPVVVTGTEVMTVAEGKTLEEASHTAITNMARLITDKFGLSFIDAGFLISIIGDLRICQIVNAVVSVRVAVPRSVLPLL